MSDLTTELRCMADGAADWARPLAASAAMRRGDRRRRHAFIARCLGGLSVAGAAAAVALAVAALVPAAHPAGRDQAGHQPAVVRLAAWTVVRQDNGTVSVTIREFQDPAALQRTLRADGVPASVIFYPSKLPRGVPFSQLFNVPGNPCDPFSGGQGQLLKVVPPKHPVAPLDKFIAVIYPAAIPSGAGLQFIATTNVGYLDTTNQRHALGVWLVQASLQCTGTT